MPPGLEEQPNDSGLSCASNMLPLGREVQAERHSILQAYRDSSKPLLGSRPFYRFSRVVRSIMRLTARSRSGTPSSTL
jgi:hypothetical protein